MRPLLVLSLLATGCASLGTMQTASTMGKGRVQGGVESNAYIIVIPNAATAASLGVNPVTFVPTVNGFVRFGVTDNIDIGLRGGSTLVELQSKFMFTDAENPRLAISLAPALSGFYLPSFSTTTTSSPAYGALQVPVPLLIGIKISDHELVFGARMLHQLLFVNDGSTLVSGYQFGVGGSIGFGIRLADSFMLFPEVSTMVPLVTTAAATNGASATNVGPGSIQFNFGVGAIFGRMKPRNGAKVLPVREEPDENAPPPPPLTPAPLPDDIAPPPPPPPPAS